jgi:tRNA A-37 threonylcarbamoyl transferase component Bud32
VDLPELSFFLKHHRFADTRAWLRQWVRPSKARLEQQHSEAVARCGIATITTLAVGEQIRRFGPGESYLITRSLGAVQPVGSYLDRISTTGTASRRARLRQRLAVALGTLLAQMHDAGLRHQDLHAGNLLVQLEDDGPRLFLIDLHAVTVGRPLGWSASLANLVLLNRWFTMRASRSDRLRFWRSYCQARRHVAAPDRFHVARLARALERQTWQSNLHFWKRRDRRCLFSNRYYRRLRSPRVIGHAVSELDHTLLAPLLADPDEPFRRPGVVHLKNSRTSTVAEFDLVIAGRVHRVIYKRFRVTTWSDPWAALVRWSPALRSWIHGHGLRERLLPTPRPLAVLHRRRHGLCYEGYLLTEKVEDAVDLLAFVAGLASRPPAERRLLLRRRIEEVACLVRELHRRQLLHRDLKAANILVTSGQNLSTTAPVSLIDLVGVTRHARLRQQQRMRDLGRLHASFYQHPALTRTDKLRFLRVYLQWGLFGRERWKRWWRGIERATQTKVARNARNGRPLA